MGANGYVNKMSFPSFKAVSIRPADDIDAERKSAELIRTALEEAKKIQDPKIYSEIKQIEKECEKLSRQIERSRNGLWISQETGAKNYMIKKKQQELDLMSSGRKKMESITSQLNELYAKLVEDIKRADIDENLVRRRKAAAVNQAKGELANIKGFESIAGYEQEKQVLDKYFIEELDKERAGEENYSIPNSILFFGPKGNGKTTFAQAFVVQAGCKYSPVRAFALKKSQLYEKFMDKLIHAAQEAEEEYKKTGIWTVIFVDEFTKIADNESLILPQIRDFMKDCAQKYHTILFATTNFPERIALDMDDDEVFPYRVALDPPDIGNKIKVLKHYLKPLMGDKKVDYEKLARMLEDKEKQTGARYSINSIKDSICSSKTSDIKEFSEDLIAQNIASLDPNITPSEVELYKQQVERYMDSRIG